MSYITTISGKRINPRMLDPEQFDISDIAHALARIVRFNGHQTHSYTVGAHSCACAMLIDQGFHARIEALVHDATEAYLCDIPTPIKMILPDYQDLELEMDRAIRARFGLPAVMSYEVKNVDRMMLLAESKVLHPALYAELGSPEVNDEAVRLVECFMHYGPIKTKHMFLDMAGAL